MQKLMTGFLLGLVVMGGAVWLVMPKLMLNVHESRFDFDATLQQLQVAMGEDNWSVPKVYDIQKTLQQDGFTEMTQLSIISLCKPEYAYQILQHDADKRVSAIMPCRMGVYETQDGKVFVASMNMGLMSKMFGGNIAKVMADAAAEEVKIVATVIK